MTKLDARRWRTQHQHRNAFSVATLQVRIRVDILHDEACAMPRRDRRDRIAHVVAQMAVGARQEGQSCRRAQFDVCQRMTDAREVTVEAQQKRSVSPRGAALLAPAQGKATALRC